MTEKEWDDDLKYLILAFVNETVDFLKPKKKISIKKFEKIQADIFDIALRDRKHQKSEMLKRVPSVSEIAYSIFKAIKESVGSDSISKAVHKLVKDKLK